MADASAAKNPNQYLVQLTSLRGIACLVVLVGHVIQVVNYHYKSYGIIVDGFRTAVTYGINAEAAVLVFFVLSGCVLSLSLKNVSSFDPRIIGGFYLKRVFRLYPLLWLSIAPAIFSMISAAHLAKTGIFSDWLAGNILSAISIKHTLLALTGLYTSYNGPMWSLRVELIYSALFPAIYLLMKRTAYRKPALIALTLIALLPIPSHFGTAFGFSFAAGALIPMLPVRTSRFGVALVIICLVVLMYDRMALTGLHPPERIFDLIETVAAFVIVRDIYNSGRRYRLLLFRPVIWLGELSFSIYLLHLPLFLIIFAAVQHYTGSAALTNNPCISQIALSGITAAATIFVSLGTYNLIELPAHNFGRRLVKQISAMGVPEKRASISNGTVPAGTEPLA